MRILQFYSFYMTPPWCFVKEIYRLKFLAKPFSHLCSSLTSTISCGARKAPVQIAAFRSHSLNEWLEKLFNLACLRFLICEMTKMI